MPEYKTGGGKPFIVPDFELNECPVSAIDEHAIDTLHAVLTGRRAHKSCGAVMYGPNLADWPVWAVQAFTAIEDEFVAVESAEVDLINRNSGGDAIEED